MSKLVKGLFGGTDDSAQKAQANSNDRAIRIIEENSDAARSDANRLFSEGEQSRQAGYADVLALFGETIPQQFDAIQQGRQNMTDTLLSGQSQVQNALLGRPTDLSGLRKDPLAINTSFSNRQLPQVDFEQQPQPFNASQYLGGYFPNFRGVA